MAKLRFILIGSMLIVYTSASAGWAPQVIQDSLKHLYPNVETLAWNTDQSYYVATFTYNGFSTKVWLDVKGRWVMKQTDWQTMDQVPMSVYHTFTLGPYASDQIDDVTYVEFPNNSPIIVILISTPNNLNQYQLFYKTDGTLINARNVTGKYNTLGASTFF